MAGHPKSTRFKPGSSGNPKGRPKKPKTLGSIVEAALAKRVTVEENGRKKKISLVEVIVRRVVGKAAQGNVGAAQVVLRLKERCEGSPAERRLSAAEEAGAQLSQYAQHAALARMGEAERKELEATYIAFLAERPPPDDGQTTAEELLDRYLAFLRDLRRSRPL